jgi:hypothetical protein
MKFEILNELGDVENIIIATLEFVEVQYPGRWRLLEDNGDPASDQSVRRITQLAFRNRFTQAEKIAIDLASIDNPAAEMPARIRAAAIRVDLADVAAATHIDLALPRTRSGVISLETAGILGAGRAGEILDADIQPDERV